jgi:hypothetical protein
MIYGRRGTSFFVITIGREARYRVSCVCALNRRSSCYLYEGGTNLCFNLHHIDNAAKIFSSVAYFQPVTIPVSALGQTAYIFQCYSQIKCSASRSQNLWKSKLLCLIDAVLSKFNIQKILLFGILFIS